MGLISISGIRVWRNFGWSEDPIDIRDTPFSSSSLASTSVVTTHGFDNSAYFKDVSDQLQLPSCVANATADMMEGATVLDKVLTGMSIDQARASTPNLSRLFVWWNAKNEMWPNQASNPNSGTYNRLAMDVLARFGVCTESRWPYDSNNATIRPSIMSYREAVVNRFDAFYSITGQNDDRLTSIVQALGQKHNVLFGTTLDQSFLNYTSGVIHKPTGTSIGGHAMVICGWDPSRQAFKVRNSWSPSWGESGYCWMHEDYIVWSATKSLWVPVKGAL